MKRTVQGRVVYDRKRHDFSVGDLLRIARSSELVERELTYQEYVGYFELLSVVNRLHISAILNLPLRANKRAIIIVLRSLGKQLSEYLKFFFKYLPGQVVSIIVKLMSEFIGGEEENGEEND